MSSFQFNTEKGTYPVKVHITPALSTLSLDASQQTNEVDRNTTLILLNALGVTRNKYQKFIEGLSAKGFTVFSADYPCCGENKPTIKKGIDYDYNHLVTDFIPKLINKAQTEYPDNRIILVGHSLGGHVATLYSASSGQPFIGIATGNVHYKNWSDRRGQLRVLSAVTAIQILLKIYGYLPGEKIGVGDQEAKTLMQQWCQTALTGTFKFMTIPMTSKDSKGLYINIEGDHFAPMTSMQGLANLCAKPKIVSVKLEDNLLATKGNPHSIWVKQPTPIIDSLCRHLTFLDR